MKTLVVLDETIVRYLLELTQSREARLVGDAESVALRAETERQLQVSLDILERARKEAE